MEVPMKFNAIIFDVNETLLDLAALDRLFERHLGSATWRRAWFSEMLITSMTLNQIGRYERFSDIGRACLITTTARAEASISDSAIDEILHGMQTLPPHPDVIPGLERLTATGVSLVTLTNSPPDVAKAQIEHAGLADYFDDIITVDDSQRLKPAREVYEAAGKRLAAPASTLMLVAAHTWDIAGASHAGWQTAFLTRGHQVAHPLYPQPTLAAPDLAELAEEIVKMR